MLLLSVSRCLVVNPVFKDKDGPMADSPLTAAFRSRGVPLLEFGPGARVPLRFGDPVAEQGATRTSCGLYDFSFMACFEVSGADAVAFLNRLQMRHTGALAPGELRYTLLLNEDGTVFIDATVWRLDAARYWLVSGRPADRERVGEVARAFEVEVRDLTGRHGVIALQGPASAALLRRAAPDLPLPGYFHHAAGSAYDRHCRVARIGYTGEIGYELFVHAADAPDVWERLLRDGRNAGLVECGFEAVDALRVEAGFILFSRELVVPVMPDEIGLGRLASAGNPAHIGIEALALSRRRGVRKLLAGLVPDARFGSDPSVLARLAYPAAAEAAPGRAAPTSFVFSALYGKPLALGFVHPEDRYPGIRVALGNGVTGRVARLPFYDPMKQVPRA